MGVYLPFNLPPSLMVSEAMEGEWGCMEKGGRWELRTLIGARLVSTHSSSVCVLTKFSF